MARVDLFWQINLESKFREGVTGRMMDTKLYITDDFLCVHSGFSYISGCMVKDC